MKPNPAEAALKSSILGSVLYTEPYNYTQGGQEYRSVCRIHSKGMSKSLLRKDGIKWTTLEHSEVESNHPLTILFAKP